MRVRIESKGIIKTVSGFHQKDGVFYIPFFLATGYPSLSTLDPVALRPCFSTGLPFSKSLFSYLTAPHVPNNQCIQLPAQPVYFRPTEPTLIPLDHVV
jgi:hypothetical protein